MPKPSTVEVVGCLSVVFTLGVAVAFYGSIIAVAVHFITKFW